MLLHAKCLGRCGAPNNAFDAAAMTMINILARVGAVESQETTGL